MGECRRPSLLFALLTLLAAGAFALALLSGSGGPEPAVLWQSPPGPETALAWNIVRELRLPRALSAFAVGGLLALAGALMQSLLRWLKRVIWRKAQRPM